MPKPIIKKHITLDRKGYKYKQIKNNALCVAHFYCRKYCVTDCSFVFFFRHGVRNSLLLAPMPTASTAQILGNNESIEPYTSNIYTRRVLSGEFQVITNGSFSNLPIMRGNLALQYVQSLICTRLFSKWCAQTFLVFGNALVQSFLPNACTTKCSRMLVIPVINDCLL